MIDDQASSLRKMKQSRLIKVIAVTGGKGGVGKTNITLNTAIAMAKQGKRVMVLDADLGLANVDVMLGLRVEKNLSHVLSGECTLDEVLVTGPHGIKIAPATSGTQSMAELSPTEHAGLIRAFSELRSQIDVLIVDTAAGISDMVLSFSKASQDIMVVVCDEPTSALDVSIQAQILNLLKDLQEQLNLTILFISHDLPVVRQMCDDIGVLRNGKLCEVSETEELFKNPNHEYTKELLRLMPKIETIYN